MAVTANVGSMASVTEAKDKILAHSAKVAEERIAREKAEAAAATAAAEAAPEPEPGPVAEGDKA